MAKEVLIIAGSARPDGNTGRIVAELRTQFGENGTLIDLADLAIGPFRYGGSLDRDDLVAVVSAMLASHHLVFATPVYWYAMSGAMKTLFDRFTDLLGRPEGRALAGRQVWLVATGTDPALPEGFDVPFARTAEWFDMAWRGATYIAMDGDDPLHESALAATRNLAGAIRD